MEIKGRTNQSVEKAMVLLDCFWKERKPLSIAELSALTSWPKSTIHALLLSMLGNETVQQLPSDGRYALGPHLFELGCASETWWREKKAASYYLRTVTEKTGESVYLGKREGDEILLIDGCESRNPNKILSSVGTRMPLYCCSQGKVILAHMPKADYQRYARACHFHRYTSQTISSIAELTRCVHEIQETGLAVEHGDLREGVLSIATPIFKEGDKCDYAIGIVLRDLDEPKSDRLDDICALMVKTAAEITQELRAPAEWNGLFSLR